MEGLLIGGVLFFLLFGSVLLVVVLGYRERAGRGEDRADNRAHGRDSDARVRDMQDHVDREQRLVDDFLTNPSVDSLHEGTGGPGRPTRP